ncbi:MAG TPA: hypothetical protein VEK76_05750 [Candidatus Binatia bacterium]|nr:hypothetical protein [Candidatus Binatia bacterium]
MACAECGCIVEAGARIAPCGDPRCCCRDVPVSGTLPPAGGPEPAAGGETWTSPPVPPPRRGTTGVSSKERRSLRP